MKDKNVLVTGATGGIGEALSRKLFAQGASLVLQGRNTSKLAALQSALDPAGKRVSFVAGDINVIGDREKLLLACKNHKVNTLINNAGINQFAPFVSTDISTILNTNTISTMCLTQSLLPQLLNADEAMIVNIGSAFGSIGYPGYVAYCAAKHAIKGFSEALHRELQDTQVKVIYISPRATSTDMNSEAANQMNESLGVASDTPEFVANHIIKAIHNQTDRSQLGWPERIQTRINGLFPGLVDTALRKQLPTIKRYLINA